MIARAWVVDMPYSRALHVALNRTPKTQAKREKIGFASCVHVNTGGPDRRMLGHFRVVKAWRADDKLVVVLHLFGHREDAYLHVHGEKWTLSLEVFEGVVQTISIYTVPK